VLGAAGGADEVGHRDGSDERDGDPEHGRMRIIGSARRRGDGVIGWRSEQRQRVSAYEQLDVAAKPASGRCRRSLERDVDRLAGLYLLIEDRNQIRLGTYAVRELGGHPDHQMQGWKLDVAPRGVRTTVTVPTVDP
jgi:hypothetical protein